MVESADAQSPSTGWLTPTTLCIDVGGTGLKASIVDSAGSMVTERVRVPVEYPMSPTVLVDRLAALTRSLPEYQRVSVGFPGVVRSGQVLTAPHFVEVDGPGSSVDAGLLEQWTGFDLATAVAQRFGKPTRVINDADLQGLDVMTESGIEMVITLGTGVGTCIINNGVLGPHIELAHHRFRHGETYDEQLGNAARKRVGNRKWNKRVARAVAAFDALVLFDTLYVGGGNSRHITTDLGPKTKLIDTNAGILGGVKLWSQPET
jgi:polyphosphate glucokinase